MVFLMVFVLILTAVCARTVWSRRVREPRAARPWREGTPSSVEGVLTAQLTAGDITPDQYVATMERIAAAADR